MSYVTSAPTFAASEVVTAVKLNALADGIQAAWTTYTPTWTASVVNPVLNNGSISGKYIQVGKTVHFWMKLTVGSTTTVGSGTYKLTLPVAPVAGHLGRFDLVYTDVSGGGQFRGITFGLSASTVQLAYDQNGATNTPIQALTNTSPFVPATGDVYEMWGTYEAA